MLTVGSVATDLRLGIVILSLLLVLRPLLSEEKCHSDDKKALLKIKKAFNNPYLLASWQPNIDCCTWYCVKCDDVTNRIIEIFISDGDLPGQIPDAIADLPYLKSISFHKVTKFSGPIPYSITKVKYLDFLRISYANLTGTIPEFLGQLKNLTYLNLSYNNLTGPIPSSLGQIPKLGYIGLDQNKLTGTIPPSLVNLKGSELYLILSHNQLSGEIPASFQDIDFGKIDLSRNKLQGDISMLFGYKKTTYMMDFSRNMFEFNMSKLHVHQSLVYLDINHNRVFGSIPEVMTKLALQSFNVSYNRLCGKIPQGGRLQTRFDYSAYFHNRCLCGSPLDVACK
ncbi:polygalacturonase inhibitor-like [Punica granatum]|uniref:Leucine-rich repeat-containing N-terminal plant-type domain-containing protein n=2 Tax=Punica granatum TaxID=22663 RepID=A0A218XD65_PUNGR|nr:polygalacturonase inhibitor-like [Punica granatum]OWM82670.1 hypothetical protein CDL15_Pgr002245 [Punica granatum]PKI54201.1 hypothetical protein CRG98_025434 [Punica granatum]